MYQNLIFRLITRSSDFAAVVLCSSDICIQYSSRFKNDESVNSGHFRSFRLFYFSNCTRITLPAGIKVSPSGTAATASASAMDFKRLAPRRE